MTGAEIKTISVINCAPYGFVPAVAAYAYGDFWVFAAVVAVWTVATGLTAGSENMRASQLIRVGVLVGLIIGLPHCYTYLDDNLWQWIKGGINYLFEHPLALLLMPFVVGGAAGVASGIRDAIELNAVLKCLFGSQSELVAARDAIVNTELERKAAAEREQHKAKAWADQMAREADRAAEAQARTEETARRETRRQQANGHRHQQRQEQRHDQAQPAAPSKLNHALQAFDLASLEGLTSVSLKKLYRKLSSQYHPDKYAGASESVRAEKEEVMKGVNAAYDLLRIELQTLGR